LATLTRIPLTPSPCYKASRPLFVEHADEALYRFTKVGSALLCCFRDQSYAILARHTLTKGNYAPDQVRIPIHDDHPGFLSFDQHWAPAENSDAHDLLLYHLITTTNQGDWLSERAPIHEATPQVADVAFVPGRDFSVSGYPGHGFNRIDFEGTTIFNQRSIIDCEYVHPTDPYVHQLKARQGAQIGDFGGLSGGLVVARTTVGLVPAGLVITGSATSNIVRFIEIGVVRAALEDFARQLSAA
jgi:hypothetical protein